METKKANTDKRMAKQAQDKATRVKLDRTYSNIGIRTCCPEYA